VLPARPPFDSEPFSSGGVHSTAEVVCLKVVGRFRFEALCRQRRAWLFDLVLRPAFLGGVMKATGITPPASLAAVHAAAP
jgi:hypothetical protein